MRKLGIEWECFEAYRRGWKCGARNGYPDKRFTNHDRNDLRCGYERGFGDGRDALLLALAKEADNTGYDPKMSILLGKIDE